MKYSLRSLMTFSIRDLALVTMIVAVCVAWWADRSKLSRRAQETEVWEFRTTVLAEELRSNGGEVTWTDSKISGRGTQGDYWSAHGP